jgi:hypothetical protein
MANDSHVPPSVPEPSPERDVIGATAHLGKWRRVERIQPGWLVPMVDGWAEVETTMQGGPVVAVTLVDGRTFGGMAGDEVKCISNSETAQRRSALAASLSHPETDQ